MNILVPLIWFLAAGAVGTAYVEIAAMIIRSKKDFFEAYSALAMMVSMLIPVIGLAAVLISLIVSNSQPSDALWVIGFIGGMCYGRTVIKYITRLARPQKT